MQQLKISVIVPVYNVEKYLKQCLDSIVNQTYKNLEIIIVNDGTKDNSMKIVEEYLQDKRIKVINKENGGLSSARNIGIKEATGDYISFIDSDDYISLNMYEDLVKNINGEDIIIFNYSRLDDKTKKIVKNKYIKNNKMIILDKKLNYLYSRIELVCWNKIYKATFIKEKKINFLEIVNEDVFWNIEVFYSAESVKILNQDYYYYRINRSDSITAKGKIKNSKDFLLQKESYKVIISNLNNLIENNLENYSLGRILYLLLEKELYNAKLRNEVEFKKIDLYLKKYLQLQKKDEIEKEILIERVRELIGSSNTKKIFNLSIIESYYWKQKVFNINLLRKVLCKKIKNILNKLKNN